MNKTEAWLQGKYKKIRQAAADTRLNKSGTVGTEPIGKPNKNGGIDTYTEVKAGRLGKIDLPTAATLKKKAAAATRPVAALVKGTVKNMTQPDQNTLYGKRTTLKQGMSDFKKAMKKK